MAQDENADIRIRLKGAKKTAAETRMVSKEVDNLGDQAAQAARKLGALSVKSSATRVNIGPLSTTARGGALAFGALALGVEKLVPGLMSATEAVASLVGGAGAAGGVGLLALVQGTSVARLGLSGLSDALGGSEEAIKDLSPEVRELFDTLNEKRDLLRETATGGLLPGLTDGADSALRNFDVLNALVDDTAKTLGGLAREGGDMLGSDAWGRDLGKVGKSNARIIDSLGGATLHLADAARHVIVEAGPLTEWMADAIDRGGQLAETWALNARQSGAMASFFRDARRDLQLLASAGGHGRRGIVNLWGAHDVDGTKTLESLDSIMARFEEWSQSPALADGLGDAIREEIPQAVAATMDAIARNLPAAGGTAATVFWKSFWDSSAEGKALIGALAFAKLGGFKLLGRTLAGQFLGGIGGKGGKGGAGAPVPVWVMNPGFGVGPGGKPGGGTTARPKPGASTTAGRNATKTWTRGGSGVRGGGAGGIAGGIGALALPFLDPLLPESLRYQDPNDLKDQMRRDLYGRVGPGNPNPLSVPGAFEISIVPQPINLDGEKIGQSTARAEARRRARSGRGG